MQPLTRTRVPWGPYTPSGNGRDQRIDLLRGFAVVAMVVDHIAGPSMLYAITGGNRFYTSAAEGFIFISGLVMGLVYQRLVERDGLGPSLRRAIERAATLYLVTVTLTLLFIPASELLGLHWAQGLDFSDPVAFVVAVLALHQTYYLVDIPLLYTILLLISPLALIMLSQGRTVVVLAASWLLWGAYQYFPQQTELPWPIAGNYLFFLSAWQVFFFTGLVLGWHHATLTRRLSRFPRRLALAVAALGTAGLIALSLISNRLGRFLPDDPETARDVQLFLIEYVFGKADVRPGRIVASIVVFGFLYLLVTEAWRPLYRWTSPFLLPLGESALYAYAAHVALAVPIAFALARLDLPDRFARPINLIIQVASLALLWVLIRRRFLFVNPAQGLARYIWPLAATVGCSVLLSLGTAMQVGGLAMPAPEPDLYAARVARAFGTPVPGRPAPAERVVTLPEPRASLRGGQLPALGPGARASRYVGDIRGSLQSYQFFSPALQRDMRYFVYLPPGYDDANRRFSTLYMLHGNSGSFEEWVAYGLVTSADGLIVTREILPMIIIIPQGDFSYWVNHVDEGPRYGDYVAVDLVRHVNATYRTLPGAQNRAIGGLSMGGTGALINAFTHPEIFGVVGAHSPALPEEGARDFLGTGVDYRMRSPAALANTAAGLHRLSIWLDAGDQDPWLAETEELHDTLQRRGIDHYFNIFEGEHWGPYWAENLPSYLRFYDEALHPDRRR